MSDRDEPLSDEQIRLDCLHFAAHEDMSRERDLLTRAKRLYAWVTRAEGSASVVTYTIVGSGDGGGGTSTSGAAGGGGGLKS